MSITISAVGNVLVGDYTKALFPAQTLWQVITAVISLRDVMCVIKWHICAMAGPLDESSVYEISWLVSTCYYFYTIVSCAILWMTVHFGSEYSKHHFAMIFFKWSAKPWNMAFGIHGIFPWAHNALPNKMHYVGHFLFNRNFIFYDSCFEYVPNVILPRVEGWFHCLT